MTRKTKLLTRLKARPKDFTWSEATTLMRQCDFALKSGSGSTRVFVHSVTKQKVFLHEPHPSQILKPYMVDRLIEGLQNAGVIQSD